MLQESRRQQLDGIVQKMIANKEPDENIQFVVNDFSHKYANEPVQTNEGVGAKVGKFFTGNTQELAKSVGAGLAVTTGDVARINTASINQADADFRLAKLLKTATPEQKTHILSQLGQGTKVGLAEEQIPALKNTGEQVAGQALGTILEATSGGALGGAKKAASTVAGTVAKKTLGQAVLHGVGTGGIYGVLSGTGEALKQNKSAVGVATGAIEGGISGASLGGAIGAVGYGISKIPSVLGKKSEAIYKNVLKMTPPELQKEAAQGKNTPALLKSLGLSGSREEIQTTVNNILDAKNKDMEALLAARAQAGTKIATDDFEKSALNALDKYKTHVAEYGAIKSKLETIISNTRNLFGDEIPVDVANQIKSGLWKDSFNKAGSEIVNDAVYEAGSSMKGLIEAAIPDKEIAGLNAEIGKFIVASKQLDKSLTRPVTGKMSKFLGGIIGGLIGSAAGPLGALIGAGGGTQLDKVLSSQTLRTSLAALMAKAEKATSAEMPAITAEVKDLVLRHLLRQATAAPVASSEVQ